VTFQVERSLPQLEAKAQLLEAQCNAMLLEDEDKVSSNDCPPHKAKGREIRRFNGA
jgi:hypothetical protein